MKHKSRSPKQRRHPKSRLRLPDLEFSKAAVLNSLTSVDGRRGYCHAIDEFVDWYCSEPRLTLNRTVDSAIVVILKHAFSPLEPSTCAWGRFAGSHMRRPIQGYSVPIWPPASAVSKVSGIWACAWAIG